MKTFRSIAIAFIASIAAVSATGCASETEEPVIEESSLEGKADRPAQACPQMLILCIEGYRAKDLGNCRQVCVPDHGAECTSNSDCAIYCITTPCPQGECKGGTCRVSTSKPPRDTSNCQPSCGSGESCQECKTIDGSGFFCMPNGSIC